MATGIATGVTTSQCAVITGHVVGEMTTDGLEPPQLPPPTEQTTSNNGDANGNEQSDTITRGSRKRKYGPAKKWLVIKRYMIKHASPNKTPTYLSENGGLGPIVP